MKKFLLSMFAIFVLVFSLNIEFASALSEKIDPDEKVEITVTSQPKASETVAPTETTAPTATATATTKPTATATTKATATATTKATATSTAKATAEVTAKPTSTATESTATATETVVSDDDDVIVLSVGSLDDDDSVLVVETTPETNLNITSSTSQMETSKGITNFGAFMWFLFGVIVSAVISYIIAYRFYNMGRSDKHLLSEIRALKRDVDNKMVGTVSGFSEYDLHVNNGNEDYSKMNSSIRSKQSDGEDQEIYKKWENQIHKSTDTLESKPVERVVQRQASPTQRQAQRPTSGKSYSSSSERRRPPIKDNDGVGEKFKNVLGDMFPFDKNDR